ncbi:MAG: protein kinase domain-containing protein [Pyrinomonadaceae bacterium]
MNLDSGTKIGRYEIRSLLGAGGMGEVYLAFDTTLEREVAIKFLKHTDDAEKLRRFRQEAKAVSALNHSNILTIYEVGEFRDSQFIVSELVNGKNLRDFLNEQNPTLNEVLDIGIQVGNALAAAHAVGIVHRDIKPENVMVLPDGYVKVLDFGLAKFVVTEKDSIQNSVASTASLIHTKAGMLLGTVNYMSPEQLRGKPVDERTDVWSLGIVLFEMLTRRRPFIGESVSDVIAAVLEHSLPPIAELNLQIPTEVEIVIRKALEKNADNRFQTAREFVSALKNVKLFSESGNYSAVSINPPANSFHSQKTLFTDAAQAVTTDSKNLSGLFIAGTRIRWRIIALPFFLLAAMFAFVGWFYVYQPTVQKSSGKQMKSRRLTTTGNVINAVISPDGRFVAYVRSDGGQQSLWLRQVNETAGQELIPISAENYAGLTFAPDGNWIYYTVFIGNSIGKLNRIMMLGGSQQEIAKDVDSTISFAPDGKTFAFIRSNPNQGVDQIIVSNTDGSGERVLSERKRPEFYTISTRESLSWSPDGKFIACPTGKTGADGEFMSVAEIALETGRETPLTATKWHRVGRIAWTKNSDELLITAAESGSESFQVVKIFRSNGNTQNVTGELNDYYNLSLSKDSTLLLGVAYDKNSNLFTASSEQPAQTVQIASGIYDGIGGVLWMADGRIVYVSTESGNRDLWTMNADGTNRRQLTFDKAADDFPSVSNDGRFVVFVSSRSGASHLWRMNSSGGELKQLTDKGGENLPVITPDGNFVIYSARAEGRLVLWRVSVEGGEPLQLTKEQTSWAAISPDGKLIACLTRDTSLESLTTVAVVSAETGNILKTFKPAGHIVSPTLPALIRWMPDGQTIAYVAHINGISNVWAQAATGGEPKKLTDFTADRIFSFDWSKDGKRIIYARGVLRNDLILIENF